MTVPSDSEGFSPSKTRDNPDSGAQDAPEGCEMQPNLCESGSFQTESEERALRATGALNALQYLVTTSSDLGGLQGAELGWLMDLVFGEAKAAMVGRHALLKPSNDDVSRSDFQCR